MADRPRPFIPVASLLDVEGKQVFYSITGRICRRNCKGREANTRALVDQDAGAFIAEAKAEPDAQIAAHMFEFRAADALNNIFASGRRPEDVCANLAPEN